MDSMLASSSWQASLERGVAPGRHYLLAALPMMAIRRREQCDDRPAAGPDELVELFLWIVLIGGGYTMLRDWLVAGPARPSPSSPQRTISRSRG